jgi:putative sterol carrier protein
MTEDSAPKKEKKRRLLGFAGIIYSTLEPLNSSEYFKEKYSADNYSILLVAKDDTKAALVHFKDGTVEIEQVKNKPEELKPLKYQGRIIADVETFMKFAMGKINPIKAVLTRKLRIKGIKNVLQFSKYFKVLAYIQKQAKITSE